MKCRNCPYWDNPDENFYGVCTCKESPDCGYFVMGMHECETEENKTEANNNE